MVGRLLRCRSLLLLVVVPLLVSSTGFAKAGVEGERLISPARAPQTPVQRAVCSTTRAAAILASSAAAPSGLELFGAEATRRYLAEFDDGTGLQHRGAEELYRQFWDELSVAELVHNFGNADASANCGMDVTLAIGEASSWFENQWELQARGQIPVDAVQNNFSEWSETVLFSFPPFANTSDPDLPTALSRPIYGAVNMYRGSGGNPQCGAISAVFRRAYIGEAAILASPLDTGNFEIACSQGQATGQLGNVTCFVCDAWPPGERTLGSPPYLMHLLEPYLRFYNATQEQAGDLYPYYNLARLLTRLLSRKTYQAAWNPDERSALRLNFLENTLGYFEMNVAASIRTTAGDGGIKMMIGMFELLFGTQEGEQLRAWCIQRGWPLVWAYNPVMSFYRCGPDGKFPACVQPPSISIGMDTAAVRLLDPVVLSRVPAGYNASAPGGPLADALRVTSAFAAAWAAINATALSRDELHVAWTGLITGPSRSIFLELALEPPFHGSCEDEACVGVTVMSQLCVCSPSSLSPHAEPPPPISSS
jgi:hypothetical protein